VLRAALFDFDGTLVHTDIDFVAMKGAVLAIVAEAGVETAPLRDRDALAIVRDVRQRLGSEEKRFVAKCEAAMIACELAALRGAVAASGAAELLAWLRARDVRIGIVTRNSRIAVSLILQGIPLPHDVLLTRDDVARTKPDPAHLQAALDQLGVVPGDAVMVGDHVMDIVAGRAARMRSIAIVHGAPPAGFERAFADSPPDRFVRSFAELRALMLEL
jgi:HAD superfamily hydrolase (TIGR01509 family)